MTCLFFFVNFACVFYSFISVCLCVYERTCAHTHFGHISFCFVLSWYYLSYCTFVLAFIFYF